MKLTLYYSPVSFSLLYVGFHRLLAYHNTCSWKQLLCLPDSIRMILLAILWVYVEDPFGMKTMINMGKT